MYLLGVEIFHFDLVLSILSGILFEPDDLLLFREEIIESILALDAVWRKSHNSLKEDNL